MPSASSCRPTPPPSCRVSGGKVLAHRRYPFPGTIGLLVLPGAGAVEPRQGAGPVQCRRRHGELDQAGARVRREPDDEARRAADVRHRRARAGTGRVAGAEPDRELLLGPERPHPRLHRPGEVEDAEQLAEHDPCRLLLGDAALPQDDRRHGCGRGQEGRRGDGGADEEDAGRGRLLRQDHDPRGRPQPHHRLSVRGEEAVREQGAVGLLQAGRHHAGRPRRIGR